MFPHCSHLIGLFVVDVEVSGLDIDQCDSAQSREEVFSILFFLVRQELKESKSVFATVCLEHSILHLSLSGLSKVSLSLLFLLSLEGA